jgi:hypothetical protein
VLKKERVSCPLFFYVTQRVEGNEFDKDAFPQDEPFYIECVAALNTAGDPAWEGTPIVYFELLVNCESLAASQHMPYNDYHRE